MKVLFPTAGRSPGDLVEDARRLANDLARLVETGVPPADVLAAAPLLDFWEPAVRRNGALVGIVSDHPHIAGGHSALTSELFAVDREGCWARTWSRFYRLGRPAPAAQGRPQ